MLKTLKKYALPITIAISALSISGTAAFYSISGLSKLFAGAAFAVIIMATALEISKLVLATLLHQYWDRLGALLKTYLTTAVVVLILITSLGIYGFLSAAYQETANKSSIIDTRIAFLEQKRDFYQADVDRFDGELERISGNITTLSQAKSRDIQVRDTTSATGFRNTISTSELRLAQARIETEEQNRKDVQAQRSVAADSLQKFQIAILDANVDNDIAAELGPLKYLSGITGIPMDLIINYLLLIIIFVFDPLAVSMVLAANYAFDITSGKIQPKVKKEKEWEKYLQVAKEKIEDKVDTAKIVGAIVQDVVTDKVSNLKSEPKKEQVKVEEPKAPVKEIVVNRVIEKEEDWDVVAPDRKGKGSRTAKIGERKVARVMQKGPARWKVQFTDGTVDWIAKKDVK
jgi:hypothetical protein